MLTLLHRPPAQTTTISTSFSFFAAASTPPPPPLDASIAASILAATPQTLPRILQDPTIQWTPDLVDKTLKRLWNHAPMALSFFAHLSRLRPRRLLLRPRRRPRRALPRLPGRVGPCGPDAVPPPRPLPEDARHHRREMKKRKCDIDVVTYTTVINGFGIVGEIEEAKREFDDMSREGILPSVATYNAMIQVLYRKDNVDNAILVFEEMLRKDYVPNSITYNLGIRGLCHAGQMDRAVE